MITPHPLAAPPSAASPSSGVLPRLRALRAANPRARLVLAIDYDGTLTPIVADPAAAHLAPAVRETLLALAALPDVHVVISSGRARAALDGLTGGLPESPPSSAFHGLGFSTSHGFVIEGAFGSLDKAAAAEPSIAAAAAQLAHALRDGGAALAGATLERAPGLLTVHYRNAADASAERSLEHLVAAAATAHKLARRPAKCAFELRASPADGPWHKGAALEWILERLVEAGGPPTAVLTIGDDHTDEDMFVAAAAAAESGACAEGWAVRVVGNGEERATAAAFALDDPAAVARLLEGVLGEMARGGTGEDGRAVAAL